MSKSWDSDRGGRDAWIAWLAEIMREVYRVLKPGAHGLVWSLPRTSHWTATALEDAGFDIRDCVYHAFGSGFPKSHNISVAIDKMQGAEREVIGTKLKSDITSGNYASLGDMSNTKLVNYTAPATPEAEQWNGYGTALKPSVECWWLVRKPISEKNIAENVLRWGVGGLNIDECRVGNASGLLRPARQGKGVTGGWSHYAQEDGLYGTPDGHGRFPSHLLMSHTLLCDDSHCSEDCPVRLMDEQSGTSKSIQSVRARAGKPKFNGKYANGQVYLNTSDRVEGHNDQGGASRYFKTFKPEAPFIYAAKASRRDRSSDGTIHNTHPTCKSTELMRYMVKLICPPGGVVLDPFCGSGSTLVSCVYENLGFIGIEQSEEYVQIAQARINHAKMFGVST